MNRSPAKPIRHRKPRAPLSSSALIALGFLLIILAVTLLLMLAVCCGVTNDIASVNHTQKLSLDFVECTSNSVRCTGVSIAENVANLFGFTKDVLYRFGCKFV